jgi:hypothetical protein
MEWRMEQRIEWRMEQRIERRMEQRMERSIGRVSAEDGVVRVD